MTAWMSLLFGCATGLDLGRATVLSPGEARASAGTSLVVTSPRLAAETYVPLPWVQLHGGWHRGLPGDWEVGGRAWGFGWPNVFSTFGLAFDAKRQLRRGVGPVDPDLALLVSPSWYRVAVGGTGSHVLGLDVPLLAGYRIQEHQLVLAPRVGGWLLLGESQAPLVTASVGAGVAFAFDVGRVELVPQLSWRWAPVGFNGEASDARNVGLAGFETGLAVSW